LRRILKRRPSAPMIIAIVALVAALGGTAIAGGGFLTKKKFNKFQAQVVKGPITYVNTTTSVNTGASPTAQTLTATCPAGFVPVGGSAKTSTNSATSNFFLFQDYPSGTSWVAQVYVGGPPAESVTVTAICESGTTSGAPPAITG
jgi:hypothetical protein